MHTTRLIFTVQFDIYILLLRKAKQQTNNPLGHASDNADTAHQRSFTWGNCHHWYRLDHTTTSQRNLLQRSRKLHYQKVDDHSATFLLQQCQTTGINKKTSFLIFHLYNKLALAEADVLFFNSDSDERKSQKIVTVPYLAYTKIFQKYIKLTTKSTVHIPTETFTIQITTHIRIAQMRRTYSVAYLLTIYVGNTQVNKYNTNIYTISHQISHKA